MSEEIVATAARLLGRPFTFVWPSFLWTDRETAVVAAGEEEFLVKRDTDGGIRRTRHAIRRGRAAFGAGPRRAVVDAGRRLRVTIYDESFLDPMLDGYAAGRALRDALALTRPLSRVLRLLGSVRWLAEQQHPARQDHLARIHE